MHEFYDALIIGGGINGCAIARKLALDGKKVCLLERHTIGCGTSSNSSKLIHGGLRYLETGRFGLVMESLKDRKRLFGLYPNLVEMVPFYLPIYDDSVRPWWIIRIGLGLYDLFSRQAQYSCCKISNGDFADKFPGIKTEKLRRVYVYFDGKTNDLEITRRIAQDAYHSGCVVRENCQVISIGSDDKIFKILYRDSSGEHEVDGPLFINATGPWIDEVNNEYHLPHNHRIQKISGIHIVINRLLVPDCMFLQTNNRRIFFMIPWTEGKTIIGTTERIEGQCCDEIKVQEEDINYLLVCANCYLQEPITRQDICNTFLGIRPLVMNKNDDVDATCMSRDYKIDVITKGTTKLINVYGGKLTTCLSMAEKVAAHI
ncbi:MAG: glycerol-3-phosphate dehydrogenase/oxidase [Syntrophomonadaceae bacterium]|nr:glycerol-3-phosphate dehydrogenase/oxidase [Syntrophomonadaceae bacterium]